MGTPLFVVDAFTDKPFAGNAAAVCLLEHEAPESWMQSVAAEMNLSETAFLHKCDHANGFNLRWFTPAAEVALCGHATIASSHALWESSTIENGQTIHFHTHSGELTATKNENWVELDFPALEQLAAAPPMELTVALGAQPSYTGRSSMDMLCVFESEAEIRSLTPDFLNLGKIPNVRGIIATALADENSEGYDFVSRFFCPAVGVNEDPATGSSHCVLGPYWAKRLGKLDLKGHQLSKRTGKIRVIVAGDRVKLLGQAKTITAGELKV